MMQVQQFKRCEIVLHSTKAYDNPFADVDINAVFTFEDGSQISLPGFWNGGDEWKVRFSGEKAGKYTYAITCTDPDNASLTAKGEIEVLPCKDPQTELEKHGYVRLEPGKRYMVYGDGTPFFWLGDTHWQMPDFERLHECNYPGCTCGNQFLHLLKDRVKKGFTVYQTYFDSAESDGGGNKRVHHWWSEKYTRINPQAFNETMDIMMEELASRGMTVALGFGVHCSTTRAMGFKAEPLLKFARYCVARYACYPLVWITGQEVSNELNGTDQIWAQVGALVGELDGYHRPNGAHQHVHTADSPRSQKLDAQPWHQWWTLQAGHGGIPRLQPRFFYQGYRDLPSGKLYIETECHYEDIYCSGFCGYDASRIGAWNALQAGCAGFTYGVTGVWAIEWNNTDDRGWRAYSPDPWYIGMDKPGSTEMTYLRRFFEYVGFTDLEPSFGFDCGAFEMRKYVSASHKGQDVFVYYFFDMSSTETGMAMGMKPSHTYQMRWYDPMHGKFIDLPASTTNEKGELILPEKPCYRDWALLMTDIDLGAYETEEYPAYLNPVAPTTVHPGKQLELAKLTVSSEEEGHPAAAMLDGNNDTYWCGFAPSVSQTIIADLGSPQNVGWFRMASRMKDFRFIRYRVYGSLDGENYTLLSERSAPWGVAVGGQYNDFYDFLSGTWRYIKIFLPSAPETPALQIHHFGIFEK